MMNTKLASIRGSDLTQNGLAPSRHPLDVQIWRDGRNVLFRELGPQKQLGRTNLVALGGAGVVRGMGALQDSSGTQRLFLGDEDTLYMWDTSTLTAIKTGLSGATNETSTAPATAWSIERFGDWAVATNGVDAPQIWKTGSSSSNLSGLTFTRAQIFLKRAQFILAFNTNNGALPGAISFEWCDEDDPEDWTPTAVNAAGNLTIRDMDGEIKAAVNFGPNIAVAGKDSLYLVPFVGSPVYFAYNPALTGIGAVGKMAMVQAGQLLFGMSRAGIWRSDGVSYDYIDTPDIRADLRAVMDTSQLSKTVAWHDDENDMVMFSIPTTAASGEPGITAGYNYKTGAWTLFDWAVSGAVPQQGVFDQPYTAISRDVVKLNSGVDAHTSALTAYVQTAPMDFGDANAIKSLDSISVEIRRLAGTARIRVGSQMNLDDAIGWSDYITIDDGFETVYLRGAAGSLSSGRFFTLEINSNAVGDDWAASGFDIYGRVTGRNARNG